MINVAVNQSDTFAVVHALGIIGMLFALQWAIANLDPREVVRYLAVFLAPLVVYALWLSVLGGGLAIRQSPIGIHPNWWGEVAFALSVSALALTLKWRFALIAAAVALMVMVESRGALLASVVAVSVYVAFSVNGIRLSSLRLAAGFMLAAVMVTVLWFRQDWIAHASSFVSADVLLLHDPHRGLDTGLTGRIEGWIAALGIIAENPIFGAGLDTLDTHNGFLQLAAETGLPFFLLVVVITGIALRRAYISKNYLTLSVILGYLALVMTYPRMLNMNIASALFYLFLFWSVVLHHRHVRRRRGSRSMGSAPGAIIHQDSHQPGV